MALPTPMKVVLALFIIVLIGLGFWLVDWQKKMNEIKQQEKTLADKNKELEDMKQLIQELPQEKKRQEELKRELREVIQEQLTPETESEFVPSYIADIEKLVEQERTRMGDQDFIIQSLTPGALTTVGGGKEGGEEGPTALAGYPTRTFQMALAGRYPTIIDFLRQLGALKLKRLVTINRISLAPSGEIIPGRSPMLSIQMPITAYLRQPTGGGQ